MLKQELMNSEAAKQCVSLVPFKSRLLMYFCFGEAQYMSCGPSPILGHAYNYVRQWQNRQCIKIIMTLDSTDIQDIQVESEPAPKKRCLSLHQQRTLFAAYTLALEIPAAISIWFTNEVASER